ncbi:hypothetical protein B4U79_04338 [Dinothrombium tinctorium]|uniref:Proteasomal ATPase second OB domain-containing protein n=1 Tax=Dinothrombium tinctorium TaxID=1965070 RepID=A0A3S3S147_9ACAR|nr:hypothetical protein B4U79_04338 [Dinothrombium tinctorium]
MYIEEVRGTPMMVATLQELMGERHAIISVGPNEVEYYVTIRSIVDRDALELNSKVLVNSHNFAIVGVLKDDCNPLLTAMRVDKAPQETFEDIGKTKNI